MILQALTAYYDRLLAKGEAETPGLQRKAIPWVIELADDGRPLGLSHTERRFTVPAEVKRTVGIAANLLWDNPEYVLGLVRKDANEKQAAKVPERRDAFVTRINSLPDDVKSDAGVGAVLAFLNKGDRSPLETMAGWETLATEGGNVSFRLDGDDGLVCERPAVREAITDAEAAGGDVLCLVSGRKAPLAVLHPSIKGVRGGQSSGVSLVSFNLSAFTSHGWEQGRNAPVSERAAFAYTAALNCLLSRDNRERHLVEGDTTFVFWAANETPMEDMFGGCFSGFEKVRDVKEKSVKKTLRAVRDGLRDIEGDTTPFFVLALAPNAARLAVRFWYEGTVAGMAGNIGHHFDALDIVALKERDDAPLPGLWSILGAVAIGGDPKSLQDNLRGVLAADIVRAALEGTAYPATLLARTVERCRVEQFVPPIRAAVIKAVLSRRHHPKEREVTVSLDPENTNPGYLLGRLFAVLEGAQRNANPGINATIRDRYFAAASAAPRSVFVELMRLKNAHLKKVRRQNEGYAVRYERLIDEITQKLDVQTAFPDHLALDDQGRFIIGYHHQNHDLYVKRETEA